MASTPHDEAVFELVNETVGDYHITCYCDPFFVHSNKSVLLQVHHNKEQYPYLQFSTPPNKIKYWLPRLKLALNPEHDQYHAYNDDYRRAYLDNGTLWYANIALPESEPLPCTPAVRLIIKLGDKAKFKDFVQLKVGGRDKFSRMKQPDLLAFLQSRGIDLSTDTLNYFEECIDKANGDGHHLINVLRWIARGLPIDMALHKVLVDIEVNHNARGYFY